MGKFCFCREKAALKYPPFWDYGCFSVYGIYGYFRAIIGYLKGIYGYYDGLNIDNAGIIVKRIL